MLPFHRREHLGKVIQGDESAEQDGDGREVAQEGEPDPEAGRFPGIPGTGLVCNVDAGRAWK